jgi:serine kinase of HPr protein (carbohydrate metabolism regulator)
MSGALHGTAVEIDGYAVLFTGKSGSGKSDLAMRMIDRGAQLVGDDYVKLEESFGMLHVGPTDRLAGKLEVRGIGIVAVEYCAQSPLILVVELGEDGERVPASLPQRELQGWSLPMLRLNGFAASAPIKVAMLLKSLVDAGQFPVRLSAPQ